MSRYIEEKWLNKRIKDSYRERIGLDSAPSIDIVRCGECKYRTHRVDLQNDYCIQHSKVIYSTDGYCSWGERKGDE